MSATLTAHTGSTLFSSAALGAVQAAMQGADAVSLDSRNLLQGQKVVTIAHNGSVYRLQATKLGKLILTK